MKFKIFEQVLSECVGAPDARFLSEINASSLQDAIQLAKTMFPNSYICIHDAEGKQYHVTK